MMEQAADTVVITVAGDFPATADPFGIQQLYPSKAGTTSWNSLHWDNGNPRIVSSSRDRDPDDPTGWSMKRGVGSLNFDGAGHLVMKGDQPRIYLSQVSEKLWLNVEATVYYKRLVDDGTDFGGLVIGARSGPEGHTTSSPCTATTYHGRFRYDANMDFNKELQHQAGSKSRLRHDIWNGNGLPFNTWIGMKYVVHNVENGVKLELYRDLTEGANGGSWVLMGEITDSGSWEAAAPDCEFPTDLEPILITQQPGKL